jgi:hypothetical protein
MDTLAVIASMGLTVVMNISLTEKQWNRTCHALLSPRVISCGLLLALLRPLRLLFRPARCRVPTDRGHQPVAGSLHVEQKQQRDLFNGRLVRASNGAP